MKVRYTDEAIESLEEVLEFLSDHHPPEKVESIRITLLDRADGLADHPRSGKRELYLDHLNQKHRSIIEHHCKIIYRIEKDIIYITDFFDTRQAPQKMKG